MDMDFATSCPLVRPVLPHIRFLFVGSRLCSTLPSDGPSRFRPCALLVLQLHQVAQGTFTPKLSDMSDTQDAARRLRGCRRIRGDILDCRCARRSAGRHQKRRVVASSSLLTSPATRRPPPKCEACRRQRRGSLLRQTRRWREQESNPRSPSTASSVHRARATDPRRHREAGTPDRSRRRARRPICGTPGDGQSRARDHSGFA
jgi:hypothetical protein